MGNLAKVLWQWWQVIAVVIVFVVIIVIVLVVVVIIVVVVVVIVVVVVVIIVIVVVVIVLIVVVIIVIVVVVVVVYLNITGAPPSAGKGWYGLGNTAWVLQNMDDRGEVALVTQGQGDQHHGGQQGGHQHLNNYTIIVYSVH